MAGETTAAARAQAPEFAQLCAAVAEQSPEPFVAVDGASHIVRYANPAFCRLAGATSERLVGRRFADAVPEGARNGCGAMLDRVLDKGIHEVLAEQPHGSVPDIYWSYSAWPVLGQASEPVGLAVRITDATETVAFRARMVALNEALLVSAIKQQQLIELTETLSEELREAARLAALGTFATGFGHDLGNLLLPVRMHLDVIEQRAPDAAFREDVAAIRAALTYLQRLASGLKLLAADPRRAMEDGTTTDFARWWPEIRPLLRGALPHGINLEEDLPGPGVPRIPAAAVHPTALAQVLYNLVQNAGEAMAGDRRAGTGGGRRWVRVAAGRDPETGRVRITVSDNGPGMSADVLRRCTEPYFTTKTRRISTGMGLSIVGGLVESAGGSLSISSAPGQGAVFTIDLPAAAGAAGEPGRAGAAGGGGAACRVAVSVESPPVRAFLMWALRSLGSEAVAHAGASPPDADLWIVQPCDGLDGRVREFIAADGAGDGHHHRHVIVYGEPAEPAAGSDGLGSLGSCVTVTGAHLAAPQFRALLGRTLAGVRRAH